MDKYSTSKSLLTLFIIVGILVIAISIVVDIRNSVGTTSSKNVWLGVETIEINSSVMKQYNIHSTSGLLVTRTFMGSPAEISGIKRGDIIRRWDGIIITNHTQFQKLIKNSNASQRVKLNIDRQNKPILLYAKLGVRPGTF